MVAAVVQLLTEKTVHDKTSAYQHADCPLLFVIGLQGGDSNIVHNSRWQEYLVSSNIWPNPHSSNPKRVISNVPPGRLVEAQDMR